jgi:CRP-like cAMP-binding protein
MSDLVRTYKDKGAQLLAKGKLQQALDAFSKVVEAVPGELGSRQKVAEILVRLGRTHEAIAQYQQVVTRYADQGQFFKATALCKVILGLDPKHVAAQQSLAKLYSGRRPSPSPQVVEAKIPPAAPLEEGVLEPAEPVVESVEIDIPIDFEPIPHEAEKPPPPPASLPVIPLFSDLSREDFIAVLNTVEVRAFDPGETIVKEGDAGHSMYAIAQGRVGVIRSIDDSPGKRVAQMNEGDFFGEMALLSESPRLATVVAEVPTVVLEFARASLEQLQARHPQVAVAIERFYRDRLLANLLRSSPLLHPLSEEQKQAVAGRFRSQIHGDRDVIIEEGQPGAAIYLLLRGRCRVFHRDASRNRVKYPELKEGDTFGEIAVVLDQPASASVAANGPVVVLSLPAGIFRDEVLSHPAVRPMILRLVEERLQRTQDLVSRQQTAALDLRV